MWLTIAIAIGALLQQAKDANAVADSIAAAKEPATRESIVSSIHIDRALIHALRRRTATAVNRGDAQLAIDLAALVVRLSEASGDNDEAVSSMIQLAKLHSRTGDFESALDWDRKAVAAVNASNTKATIAQAFTETSIDLRHLNSNREAVNYGEKAVAAAAQSGDKVILAQARNALGTAFREAGRMSKAREQLELALKLAEETHSRDGIAYLNNNIGMLLAGYGEFEVAELYLKRSLRMKEELGDRTTIPHTLMNLSDCYLHSGKAAEADAALLRAIEIASANGQKATLAEAYRDLSVVHREEGKLEQSLNDIELGLHASPPNPLAPGRGELYVQRATTLLAQRRLRAAAADASTAIQIADAAEDDPVEKENAVYVAAEIAEAAANWGTARKYYSDAIAIIERLRNEITGSELGEQKFLNDNVSSYHGLARVALHERDLDGAFQAIEAGKARTLADALVNGRESPDAFMTDEERKRAKQLRTAMASASFTQTAGGKRGRSERSRLQEEYEAFEEELYLRHPDMRLRQAKLAPVSLAQIIAALPKNAVFLDYAVMPQKTVLLSISRRNGLRAHFIPVGSRLLAQRVIRFRDQLAARDLDYAANARTLYDLLVRPMLREMPDGSGVVISADGPLWNLPFQALVRDGKFVVESHPITYVPSARAFIQIKNAVKPALAGRVLLLAHGVPGGDEEVRSIAGLYGPTRTVTYVGGDARESTFKREAGKFAVIHVAAHAAFDEHSPLYSDLKLAKDGDDDGQLEANEMMNMKLRAGLVVLSACETGRGTIGQSEGLLGMTWALFVTGVPQVVASRWKVDTRSTRDYMIALHKDIKAGQSTAQAVRAASLNLLYSPTYRHPFYWAAFSVFGAGL